MASEDIKKQVAENNQHGAKSSVEDDSVQDLDSSTGNAAKESKGLEESQENKEIDAVKNDDDSGKSLEKIAHQASLEESEEKEEVKPDPKGASLSSCLQRIGSRFGVVVTEKSMQINRASSLQEYLHLQADNLGLQSNTIPFPPKIVPADLPALVQYEDGSYAVIEKKVANQLTIWNGGKNIIKNNRKDLANFTNWLCTFEKSFVTDDTVFLSFPWFLGQIKNMMPLYMQVILASILVHCFTLVIPLLMGLFYDRILPNLAESSLKVLVTGALLILGFDYVLKNIRTAMVEKAALRVEREAEPYLLAQILDTIHAVLPSSSGHLTHAVQEFSRIKALFTTQLVLGIIDFFFLFFFLAVIYLNSGTLAIVPAVFSFLVLFVAIAYGFIIDHNVSAQSQLQSRKSSFLNEVFQGVESIKTSNAARLFISRWTVEIEKSGEMSSKYRIAQARCTTTTAFLGQLNSIGLLLVAFFLISSGGMTSGGLLATMVLSGRCIAVSASMANLITSFLFAKRSYVDLKQLLSLEKESGETKQMKVQQVHGAIAFDSVSYRYFPESPYVLENITFKTKPGEKVGIIGPMGSGKTTLLKLIAGLANPTEGVLLLDDHNIGHLDIERVRRYMGIVPQSPVLFYGTLEFNLVMGASNVTQENLHNALMISGINTFVSKHPLGLKMQILEGGKNLSRGQRQSVAIARALINDPQLMLLDEPTSSMDTQQEQIFIKQMKDSMVGKSMFIVTHRPSILQIVDRIIVIDNGRVAADDSRDAIMKKLFGKVA